MLCCVEKREEVLIRDPIVSKQGLCCSDCGNEGCVKGSSTSLLGGASIFPLPATNNLAAHLEIATEVATISYMACHLSVEELRCYVFCMSYTQVCWHTLSTIPTVNTSPLVTHLLSLQPQEWEKLLLRQFQIDVCYFNT